jgi:hypothetical protein
VAWTAEDFAKIEAAIAAGEEEVRIGTSTVRLRDPEMLMRIRAQMKAEQSAMAAAAAGKWPTTRRLARFSSGLASSRDPDA